MVPARTRPGHRAHGEATQAVGLEPLAAAASLEIGGDLPGDDERPIADDRSCLRRRQTGRIDTEPPADLVFGEKILLQRVMLRVVLDDAQMEGKKMTPRKQPVKDVAPPKKETTKTQP